MIIIRTRTSAKSFTRRGVSVSPSRMTSRVKNMKGKKEQTYLLST